MAVKIFSNDNDLKLVRDAMAKFEIASKIDPNQTVTLNAVYTPESHRAVLDLQRQLVVGNRGMGKSLWAHALQDEKIRNYVATAYGQPQLKRTKVVIGFNGSDKSLTTAPTRDALERARKAKYTVDDIWKAVIFRAVCEATGQPEPVHLSRTLQKLGASPELYDDTLGAADEEWIGEDKYLLIVFDALDRLGDEWSDIRQLTVGLLKRSLGLKSFSSIRVKIFIRPDQYSDVELFQFPDGSKLKNDHVDLSWQHHELFGLMFFELARSKGVREALDRIKARARVQLRNKTKDFAVIPSPDDQSMTVSAIAGPYMGTDARRGRVYTWVPLHLSDAEMTCSPRTFLTAWQNAASHTPVPSGKAVDHLGLIEGVRKASTTRLDELREDYRWIDIALNALAGEFVPMDRTVLFKRWADFEVARKITAAGKTNKWLMPLGLKVGQGGLDALLKTLESIGVMEERANGKINVPDIFRVDARIKRKGGVAVPKRS